MWSQLIEAVLLSNFHNPKTILSIFNNDQREHILLHLNSGQSIGFYSHFDHLPHVYLAGLSVEAYSFALIQIKI